MTSATSDIGPFSLVPRWVARSCAGSPWALALYVALADHADRSADNGWTIGREDLAAELGTSAATVDRAVKVLVEAGALVVERTRKGKEWGWSRYLVRAVKSSQVGQGVITSGTGVITGDDIPDNPLQEPKEPSPRSVERDAMFERFWKAYPSGRGNKKPAKAAFLRALSRGHEEEVRSGLKAWIAKWAGKEAEFIPYAEKWLNTEAYKNPPTTPGTLNLSKDADLDAEHGVFRADGTVWPKWSGPAYWGSEDVPSWTDRRGNRVYEDPTL